MTESSPSSAALPIARGLLRILRVLNLIVGAAALVLLVVMPNERWIMTALKLSPSLDSERVVLVLRLMGVLGLLVTAHNHVILGRLVAIVDTVRAGDPFVAPNAHRLQIVAWSLLALQFLSLAIGATARAVSTPEYPVDLDAGFSINGWLAVLLTFLLARVFEAGSAMREDLEGTV